MQKKFKALGRFLGNKAFQSRATLAVKGPSFVPTIMIMFFWKNKAEANKSYYVFKE